MEVQRLVSVDVVAEAEVIEGPLGRSKGMYTVAGRLVSPSDVNWSLSPRGVKQGDRVRLFGQSRTVVCEPEAQCLSTGSLPMFDVGRGEKLP